MTFSFETQYRTIVCQCNWKKKINEVNQWKNSKECSMKLKGMQHETQRNAA
jgi:hypothetical protein